MFNPDQPIKSHNEDILGRVFFTRSLGKAILSYNAKDSLVIGLFGKWGSGKTSIVNMALEYVEEISTEKRSKPIIIRFNPWNFSDQQQLISQFFKQMSFVLKRVDYAEDAMKAGEKVGAYAKFFEPFKLIPTIGQYAEIIQDVMKTTGDAATAWGEMKEGDLEGIRQELNSLLYKLSYKIIVVIDDIDRLNNIEIRQIFQLVKSLGDFPNTIYLLAFDKGVVINALSKVQEGSGSEYLEKVVQVPFEIPLITKQEVERLLFSKLDELIKDIPESRWDSTYWGNIYYGGMKHIFNNIRDVTRYINSLRFGFEMVKEEVNPIDFLAITSIQVFLPEVYYGIRDNKDIFAGILESDTYGRSHSIKEQAKKRCDEIISRESGYSKDMLTNILKELFPKLNSIYGNMSYSAHSLMNWRRDGRICSPDIFDVYFSLSVTKGEISLKEIEIILSLANDKDIFTEALLKLNEDGRIERFLERLEDYTEKTIPEENIENIISVLMNIGDLFPEGDAGFFGFDTDTRILRICYQLCNRFDSHDKRFNVLKKSIERSEKSLYTIVHEVAVHGQEHGKFTSKETLEPEDKRSITEEQLDKLENLVCSKIDKWANDGELSKHRRMLSILYSWKRWGHEDKVKEVVEKQIETDEGLIVFVSGFMSKQKSHGMSDYVFKINWKINLKNVSDFVTIEQIEPRIRNIKLSDGFAQLNERKQLAINTFLDTFDGKIKDTL